MRFELTREYVEHLQAVIKQKDEKEALILMNDLHPADIAEIYDELSIDEAKFLYLLLDSEKAADVLVELDEDDRERFLEVLPGNVIAKQFIYNMDSDDAADIIAELPEEKQEEVLQNIEDLEHAGDIVDLLNYDEDTAGGLMAKELIAVNESLSLINCLKEIRKQAEEIGEIYYVYVVDDDNILKGTLSLKRLLLTQTDVNVGHIANTDIISVKTDTDSEEVANVMDKYNLVALPVVDSIGRLMGRITIDDVVDVIRDEAGKDYQMVSGITEDIESSDKIIVLTRARLPWLLIGLVGGICSALVISTHEGQLAEHAAMAFFIPMIAAMGGNVGVQSSSIIVQGLANDTIGMESTFTKLVKELGVS